VQPMENLFSSQAVPHIQYSQPHQSNYPAPSQPTRGFVPTPPPQVSNFTPTPTPTTFPSYPPYAAAPPSSFQEPPRQSYTNMNTQQPSFMVPTQASSYPSSNPHQPMQPALTTPTTMQPGVMMPNSALSSITPVPSAGFMPVSTPGQQQAVPQEPPSPHAASNTSAPSFTPAATVQTADTSNVAGE
jgi:protein transport protein SEC31